MNAIQERIIEAAKTWRLNQINGTPDANAVGVLCRAIDQLLLETDLIDEDTKALFRRHQQDGMD